MNRVTVIFLALAILLAHTFAIHQTSDGVFAAPYDTAHVAFRVARNLVHHGAALWDPAGPSLESYPSPLWIAVCAMAERIYLSPTLATQTIGILCTLGAVVLLAQFSPRRMSGLAAPILLAASGSAAAAGASGTEAALGMLLATGAYLAYERRWRYPLMALLSALVLTRPEGTIVVVVLLAFEWLDRPRDEEGVAHAPLHRAFLLPLGVILGLALLRVNAVGSALSPYESRLVDADGAQIEMGLRYTASFLLASGSGLLVLLPLMLCLMRRLPGIGRRALLVVAAWMLLVTASGGDGLPFWNAMAPILPLFFLSIQQAIARIIDMHHKLALPMWAVMVIAVCSSFAVSKSPGNLGPIPVESMQRNLFAPHQPLVDTYRRPLGREGLEVEIRQTERLRGLGLFLRDKIKHPATIMTFWPGAVGYLSRAQVYDILGRAHPVEGRVANSWRGTPTVDLVGQLERRPDYVVPLTESLVEGETLVGHLRNWLVSYEEPGNVEARLVELLDALGRYEMVSVPISEDGTSSAQESPFLLLRKKALGLSPELELRLEGRDFTVLATHRGHEQLVDLMITGLDDEGNEWCLRPTGDFVLDEEVDARTNLLLYSTGVRAIHLCKGHLPANIRTVRARLHNPGTRSDANLATVGNEVTVEL